MNVSAIDKATGKGRRLRSLLRAAGDSEIDEMVRDAEENASLPTQSVSERLNSRIREIRWSILEKMLNETGDKVDGSEKAEIEAAVASLKTALESEDADAIEAEIEALTQKSHSLAEALSERT